MNLKNLMSGILRNLLSFVLMVTVCFAGTFAFATNDFLLKLQEAQEKLKSGAQHITVTKIKDEPMRYLELFRYTALDDIISSLRFEKNPWEFIKNKYEKKFNMIENCCTAVGAFAGAGLGRIFWEWVNNQEGKDKKLDPNLYQKKYEQKNFKKNENSSNFLGKIKKLALPTSIVSACMVVFSAFTNFISSLYSSNFMAKEYKKLYVGRGNALMAMECLLRLIDRKNWKQGDSILIQINSNPNYPTAVPTVIKSGINYSDKEKKCFPKAFEKLKTELEKILENNKEDYNYEI